MSRETLIKVIRETTSEDGKKNYEVVFDSTSCFLNAFTGSDYENYDDVDMLELVIPPPEVKEILSKEDDDYRKLSWKVVKCNSVLVPGLEAVRSAVWQKIESEVILREAQRRNKESLEYMKLSEEEKYNVDNSLDVDYWADLWNRLIGLDFLKVLAETLQDFNSVLYICTATA